MFFYEVDFGFVEVEGVVFSSDVSVVGLVFVFGR